MESNLSYAVPPNALRVFHGFRKETLTQEQYLEALGKTFMPSVPYMLGPLGVAAFLPGVVVGESDPGILDEFAIIAYTSQAAWQHIMKETLRGRIYDQTHSGVYDMKRSGASFPALIKDLRSDASNPYYLFEDATDWQIGTTYVFVAAKASAAIAAEEFRQTIRHAAEESIEELDSQGFDQCVIMPGDSYVVIWVHSNASITNEVPNRKFINPKIRVIANLKTQRILCPGEPPAVGLSQTTALNFIFVRKPEMFLI